jgi:hypothetical protein
MSTPMQPVLLCPLCGRRDLMRVAESYEFFVQSKEEPSDPQRGTSKMAAFICQEYGHVFFVSKADLVATSCSVTPTATTISE